MLKYEYTLHTRTMFAMYYFGEPHIQDIDENENSMAEIMCAASVIHNASLATQIRMNVVIGLFPCCARQVNLLHTLQWAAHRRRLCCRRICLRIRSFFVNCDKSQVGTVMCQHLHAQVRQSLALVKSDRS